MEHLAKADSTGDLDGRGLELLAIARVLIGDQEEGEAVWVRAHESFLDDGDRRKAARCAFWLGLLLFLRGEHARGGGWIGRSHEVLGDEGECAERGLLMIPTGLQAMGGGNADEATAAFAAAEEIGRRTNDADVRALAQLGSGQALVRQGRETEGLETMDRAMVAVEAGELSPLLTGIIYCAVIEESQRVFDVSRAREWTSALSRWCESQPDLVAYRGHCLVYRAEVVQRHGDWDEAVSQALQARDQLATPPGHPATGLALYRLGELYRLRGEFDEAGSAFKEASVWGHDPQPGLALLRFYEGDLDSASATIRRVVDTAGSSPLRCQVLPAAVRILCAVEDVDGALRAAEDLTQLAGELDVPFARAVAKHSAGLVDLARSDAGTAVEHLREALATWRDVQAPYEEALTRAEIGVAYRSLGDDDSADLELHAARTLLSGLGAIPDVERIDSLRGAPPDDRHGLTLRELQVLRLLATGDTNRTIADRLFISTRTVDRHVSNVYTKLGVSSRAAATAYAFEHRLT